MNQMLRKCVNLFIVTPLKLPNTDAISDSYFIVLFTDAKVSFSVWEILNLVAFNMLVKTHHLDNLQKGRGTLEGLQILIAHRHFCPNGSKCREWPWKWVYCVVVSCKATHLLLLLSAGRRGKTLVSHWLRFGGL